MSLILEALRKSEAERRRGNTPDVALESPPPAASRHRRLPASAWPALLAALVLAALAVWWMLPGATPDASLHAKPDATPDVAMAVEAGQPDAPVVLARTPPSPSANATNTDAGIDANRNAPGTATATPPARGITPITYGNTPLMDAPAGGDAAVVAPAPVRAELDARPTSNATMGKLSMHMWDESPARRFVILDGQRLGEGDRNGDLQVVEIVRDGVIVERNGQRARIALP